MSGGGAARGLRRRREQVVGPGRAARESGLGAGLGREGRRGGRGAGSGRGGGREGPGCAAAGRGPWTALRSGRRAGE